MPQTIRLTITPELERALKILEKSTMGTLNTTELVKMAVGSWANEKFETAASEDISPDNWDKMAALQFYKWAEEDGSINVDNISAKAKLKPFIPKPYVRNR